jgi:hypothetical protein
LQAARGIAQRQPAPGVHVSARPVPPPDCTSNAAGCTLRACCCRALGRSAAGGRRHSRQPMPGRGRHQASSAVV